MTDENDKVLTRFVSDVASHQLTVIRDEGLYRHLRFQRPRSSAYCFDLVTWPGYLVVTGDMGTWTFSRIADMFEFFTDSHFGRRESYLINPGYWSEKFEAGAGGSRRESPCFEFDAEAFDSALQEWLDGYMESCDDNEDRETAIEAISELQGQGFRKDHEAYHAVNDAAFPYGVSAYDILEYVGECQRHSHHYLWICFAIVWGIERYRTKQLVDRSMATFLSVRA